MGRTDTALGFSKDAFDPSLLPDFDRDFIDRADVEDFAKALNAPLSAPVVALNDWRSSRVFGEAGSEAARKSQRGIRTKPGRVSYIPC